MFGLRTALALVLALIAFLGFNVAATFGLRGALIDLTEERLYTLSPETTALLRSLAEPIRLTFFYSEKDAQAYPQLAAHGRRVRDLLAAFDRAGGEDLIVETVDPQPFTEGEDRAIAVGVTPIPTQSGQTLYFGLSGENAVDGLETVPLFEIGRAPYLEYDIARLVQTLNEAEQPVLAIAAGFPLRAPPDFASGRPPRALTILEELEALFEVRELPAEFDSIDPATDLLMVIHPSDLGEDGLFAIDQFVVRGGPAILLVDPWAEIANAQSGVPGADASDLEPLLAAWGIGYNPDTVALDLDRAIRVATREDGRAVARYYPLWIRLLPEDAARHPLTTAVVSGLNFGSTGVITALDGASTEFTPLVKTGPRAMLADRFDLGFDPEPKTLLDMYVPGERAETVAALVSGPAVSAYDGPLAPTEGDASADETDAGDDFRSDGEIRVLVMADADWLDDRFYLVDGAFGAQVTADNLAFALNAAEIMAGDASLAGLRARSPADRSMTAVDDLRRRAEARLAQEEEALLEIIAQNEARIAELQEQAAGPAATAEERAEIRRFRAELLDARARLRAVRRELREDVEAMRSRHLALNAALGPILLAFAGLGVALNRRRRARDRAAAQGRAETAS